jgi:hypothetical protein
MDLHEETGQLAARKLHRLSFVCFSEPVADLMTEAGRGPATKPRHSGGDGGRDQACP